MINWIKINNFKSIKSAETTFPHFGAIMGKNGVGKTNFIQAIKLIANLARGMTIEEASADIALIPNQLMNLNSTSKVFQITLEFGSLDDSNILYRLQVEFGVFEQGKTQGLLISSEELSYKFEGEWFELYLRDNLELTSNGKGIPLALEYNKLALTSYNEKYVNEARSGLRGIVIADLDSGMLSHPFATVKDHNLASILIRLKSQKPDKYKKFELIVSKLIDSFSSIIELTDDSHKIDSDQEFLLLVKEKNLKSRLSIKSASAGDLRTLYIIALAMALRSNATLIIEEIENSFHPSRLKALLYKIQSIAYSNDIQIILSTHSPIAINFINAVDIIYVDKSDKDGTKVLRTDSDDTEKIKEALEKGMSNFDYFNFK